jgi:hypothetical protein
MFYLQLLHTSCKKILIKIIHLNLKFLIMTLKKILHLSIFLICSHAFSQLGVGTSSPNPSAQLEVVSNNKGILIPRLALTTITDTTTITEGNVESMLVYNTSNVSGLMPGYYYWANGVWNRLAINTEISSLPKDVTSSNGSISGIADDAALVAMDLEVNVDGSTIEVDATNGVQLKNGGVLTAKLADNAVTTAKISDNSINTAKVTDDAITTAKVVDDAITTVKVVDDAITTAKIGTLGASDANKVLGTDALGNPVWQVVSASLGENVTSSNGSISGIADDAALVAMDLEVNVDGSTIEVDATNGVQLKNGGVLTAKLADNAVTTAKISDNSINTAKVTDDAITTAKVVDDAITTVKVVDDAITTAKIGTLGASDANKVLGTDALGNPVWQVVSASLGENVTSSNGSISGIADDAALVAMDLEVNVDGSTIEVDATNGVQLKDGGILTAKLADNSITTAKVAENAITTDKIGTQGAGDANRILGTDALGNPEWQVAATSLGENVTSTNGSISGVANDAALVTMDLEVNVDGSTIEVDATNGVQLKDGGILTAKLADNAVTTAKISDNSITNAKVADGAITNTKVTDYAITTAKVADVAITTAKVADGTITTVKVADDAITTAKIGTLGASDANKVLGTDALGDPVWQVASTSLGENVTSTNGSISGIADDAALVALDLEVNVDGSTIEVDATNGVQVKDGGILTTKLADNAVTTAKISDNSITTAKVADDAITTGKISDNAVDGTKIQVTGEAAGSMLYNDGTDWVDFPKGTAGQYLKMNAAGTAPEWTTAPTSKRIGEFVFAKSGRTTADGYLAVNPGTIANGAVLYPIWAAQYPEFVSGSDIVFPTNVEGMFLRNLGGDASGEGSYQGNATAIPTNSFTTNTTGNHNHTVYGDTAGGIQESNSTSGDTVLYNGDGQNNNENTSSAGSHSHTITGGGDVETRPINRAYQLYTIVDTY